MRKGKPDTGDEQETPAAAPEADLKLLIQKQVDKLKDPEIFRAMQSDYADEVYHKVRNHLVAWGRPWVVAAILFLGYVGYNFHQNSDELKELTAQLKHSAQESKISSEASRLSSEESKLYQEQARIVNIEMTKDRDEQRKSMGFFFDEHHQPNKVLQMLIGSFYSVHALRMSFELRVKGTQGKNTFMFSFLDTDGRFTWRNGSSTNPEYDAATDTTLDQYNSDVYHIYFRNLYPRHILRVQQLKFLKGFQVVNKYVHGRKVAIPMQELTSSILNLSPKVQSLIYANDIPLTTQPVELTTAVHFTESNDSYFMMIIDIDFNDALRNSLEEYESQYQRLAATSMPAR